MAEATTRTSRWLFRTPESAGAIYGTIAAMAVIAGTAKEPEHGKALSLTIATLLVFWLAHVYAHALAHHLRGATRLRWATVTAAMREERPMLLAPLPSFVLLLLGAVGLVEEHRAIRLALWAGVLQLFAWGFAYARRQGWGRLPALVTGVVNGVFGLVIVLLEVVLH
jgi:hypothetical protein